MMSAAYPLKASRDFTAPVDIIDIRPMGDKKNDAHTLLRSQEVLACLVDG